MITATAPSSSPRHITVIDDDEDARDQLVESLEDLRYATTALRGQYGGDIDSLIHDVTATAETFVICDHKLQPSGLASFTGAQVVARLTKMRVPSMLLTMFQSTDQLELARYRRHLPIVIGRDKFQPDDVRQLAQICIDEIHIGPSVERKPHRSLVRVEDIEGGATGRIIAVVPSWRPEHAVSLPLDCVTADIRTEIKRGSYLIASVNIDAREESDLFFDEITLVDVEAAEEPR